MGVFDLKTALLALGQGQSPIDSLAITFGVPECLLSLGKNALELLPSPVLKNFSGSVSEGRSFAKDKINALKKKLLLKDGIMEIDTERGTFRFISDSSKNKIDENGTSKSSTISDMSNAIGTAIGAGAELYSNYVGAVSILGGVQDCIDSYRRFLDYQAGPSSHVANLINPNIFEAEFQDDIQQARDAENFIEDTDRILNDISNILVDRLRNPDLEPEFNPDLLPTSSILSTSTDTPDPIFRLVFGPPKSKSGQFLFSVDGLYYDSQKGGLPEVSGVIAKEEFYKFNFPSNLGGKGQVLSSKDLNKFVDTIFDISIIDDSLELQKHYDSDHFLRVLQGQKNRHLYTLSGQVNELQNLGYDEDSAMMINTRQQLYSVASQHNIKINKRKKQIEVAVKSPTIFGKGKIFNFGEIPINDFSYLGNINLATAYENQKKLIFKQGEVSGVVLPLHPKFVKAAEAEAVASFSHLLVPPVGAGSIIFEAGPPTSGTVLSLTDSIVTDQLLAVYNFLETELTTPGSLNFNTLNCIAKTNKDKAAQLVGTNLSSIFTSGIGIPFLGGMVKLNNNTGLPSGVGSYVQLPQQKDLQNLFYNQNGMTFESWVYIPTIQATPTEVYSKDGWGASSFHRLLLGCENNGGVNNDESVTDLLSDYGSNFVRGLVCGFTRDIQITDNLAPNDASSANPVSNIHFYIAPTRSFNSSDIGFLRDIVTIDCGSSDYGTLKASFPITTQVGGKAFGDVSGAFCQINVTLNPKDNTVKMYLDGTLMTTSALDQVFGSDPFKMPRIPSFVQANSFSYSTTGTGLTAFSVGPTVSSFTPWIIGGGFSDGMANLGGFMGNNSGLESGLKGHIGSVKFYSKPLTSSEININFLNQSGFFKNILL